ncbi:hypothetical protein DERP_013120 [Dermatophagoides pteronyssinus]|uniref:Uncharacterized protein LOC113795030 isoform X1 n=3 Tax=Dermatophagoides pteronyssinus TaxID=6956 RepID=A0A6P6Y6B5_DERPT|nr:uncharacterized protein LOC113795030 isoform X1 [Dermatophagoides pteronyssinus]XP_027201008.1 uncharacterized protein LOC113795030 isoform X2 [Dermatophagoides pteronyssinus]KAH9417860.1 hypothetical protein DERP_013120 [Dermatophagoides pteronyssinus]
MILNYRHNNRLLIFNYIIIIIILISIGSNIINCQKPIDYSEHKTIQLFNVDELNVYNTMVDCVTNWRQQFSQCNLEMSALANQIFTIIEEQSKFGEIIKCCGIWLVRDCWISHSEKYCSKNQSELIFHLPFRLVPYLNKWCTVYHDQTILCLIPRYPYLAALIILTSILLIVIIVAGIIIVIVRQKRRRQCKKFPTIINNGEKNQFELTKPDDNDNDGGDLESGTDPNIMKNVDNADDNDADERQALKMNRN